LIHRRQTEDQLNRSNEAGLVILRADNSAPPSVWTNDVSGCPIPADMVPTALGIIFDGKDTGLRPEATVTDGLDNLPEWDVVIRYLRGRCRATGFRTASVIVRQTHDNQIRKISGSLEFLQLFNELLRSKYIRNVQLPADRIRRDVGPKRFNCRAAIDFNFA